MSNSMREGTLYFSTDEVLKLKEKFKGVATAIDTVTDSVEKMLRVLKDEGLLFEVEKQDMGWVVIDPVPEITSYDVSQSSTEPEHGSVTPPEYGTQPPQA